jgi:hypothetical protein
LNGNDLGKDRKVELDEKTHKAEVMPFSSNATTAQFSRS